jgi:hypothetical protein
VNIEQFKDSIWDCRDPVLFLVLLLLFAVYRQAKVITTLSTGTLIELKNLIGGSRVVIKPVTRITTVVEAVRKGLSLVGNEKRR